MDIARTQDADPNLIATRAHPDSFKVNAEPNQRRLGIRCDPQAAVLPARAVSPRAPHGADVCFTVPLWAER
jgi:hypothetical protein